MYNMIRYLKFFIATLFLIVAMPFVMAYDSNNLVESAFECKAVNHVDFMTHFQDGNVIAACIGIFCAVMFKFFRKKVSQTLRVGWLTIALTLIMFPLIMMILGIGSFSSVIWCIYIGVILLVLFLLLYLIFVLINFKKYRSAGWNFFKKIGVIVPLSFIIAMGVYIGVIGLTETWNLNQCEKYVQSRYKDFDDVAPLMLQWEKEHKLQWGNNE